MNQGKQNPPKPWNHSFLFNVVILYNMFWLKNFMFGLKINFVISV